MTRHTSHVTRHTSHVTRHTSHVTRHTSHVARQTNYVTRHTSHVARHTSHVTRYTDLVPKPETGDWTLEEDHYIADAIKLIGNQGWAAIAKALRGCTGAAVKARWDNICEVKPQLAGGGNP